MSLSPTVCPSCGLQALVFWASKAKLTCDSCFQSHKIPPEKTVAELKTGVLRILFSPIQNKDGQWDNSNAVKFDQITDYINNHLIKVNQASVSPIVMATLLDISEKKAISSYQQHLKIEAEIIQIKDEIGDYDKLYNITPEERARWNAYPDSDSVKRNRSRGPKKYQEGMQKIASLRILDQNLGYQHIFYYKITAVRFSFC